jgi:hypothetical protein
MGYMPDGILCLMLHLRLLSYFSCTLWPLMNTSSIRLVKALESVMTEEVGRLIQWIYGEDWVDGA